MDDMDLAECIARKLCASEGYDPDLIGASGRPRWYLYARQARHTLPLLAEAWDEGHGDGQWNIINESSVEYGIRERITNPYRQEDQ